MVRKQIVDTASDLFYRQGYNATGINQIIEEAQIAKSSLYQHFPSKEDLLVEYLSVTAESTDAALRAFIQKYEAPKEKALALFYFLLKFSKQTAYGGCNFLNIVAELPADNKRVRALIKKQKDGIRALFAEILKPAKKDQLADELYLLFDAALVTSKVHESPWTIKTARTIAEKIL